MLRQASLSNVPNRQGRVSHRLILFKKFATTSIRKEDKNEESKADRLVTTALSKPHGSSSTDCVAIARFNDWARVNGLKIKKELKNQLFFYP